MASHSLCVPGHIWLIYPKFPIHWRWWSWREPSTQLRLGLVIQVLFNLRFWLRLTLQTQLINGLVLGCIGMCYSTTCQTHPTHLIVAFWVSDLLTQPETSLVTHGSGCPFNFWLTSIHLIDGLDLGRACTCYQQWFTSSHCYLWPTRYLTLQMIMESVSKPANPTWAKPSSSRFAGHFFQKRCLGWVQLDISARLTNVLASDLAYSIQPANPI